MTLGEFAPFHYGKSLPAASRDGGPYPVVGSGGVCGGHSLPLAEGPLIVVGRKGTVGSVHWFPNGAHPIDTTFYVPDDRSRDPRFTYYLLQSLGLGQMNSDSAVPGLSRDRAHAVQVTIPPLEVQRGIAGVLGALDDLIDTNQRLASLTGELWRLLATAEAKREAVPLSEIAIFINGRNFTKGATGFGRPVIRTPEVRKGPVQAKTVWTSVPANEENIATRGDLLFVWSGSLCAGRWLWRDGLVNQHVFKVMPDQGIPPWLVMFGIEQAMSRFRAIAAGKATTMGHIKRSDLDAEVLLPATSTWERLDALISPLWDAELEYQAECQTLSSARDELLPLLLSGRVLPGEVASGG